MVDNRTEFFKFKGRSKRNTESFVATRVGDEERLYHERLSFRDAEQALVFGHHRHPTPKSRRGIAARNRTTYAPELRGSFSLHYFRADPSLVSTGSALDRSATQWVKKALRDDPVVSASFVATHVESDDVLLPVHPWQAEYLLETPHVRDLLGDGLEHLGSIGRTFYPTTSVRTLYSPDAPFMVKSSLNVTITNSVRTNKRPELERGVAVAELLDTAFGDELERARERYDRPSSAFLDPLLESPTVPCKANLLTRFRGLDELENQSVYTDVKNHSLHAHLEGEMAGHPWITYNKGRLGWGYDDYKAPMTGRADCAPSTRRLRLLAPPRPVKPRMRTSTSSGWHKNVPQRAQRAANRRMSSRSATSNPAASST
jgi:siderophore synthetase component